MASVSVTFEEGFAQDLVVVRVDGREVYRKEGLVTRANLGMAGSFRTEVEAGLRTIEIELPRRSWRLQREEDVGERLYLRVSAGDQGLRYVSSQEPAGHL